MLKFLLDVNNPIANFAPLLPIIFGIRALLIGGRLDHDKGRYAGVIITLACVGYSFTCRMLMVLDVITASTFRTLATPNSPNLMLVVALGLMRYVYFLRERQEHLGENSKLRAENAALKEQAHALEGLVDRLRGEGRL